MDGISGINPSARIVLVGITPGPTQMVNANNEARRALQAGKSNTEAIQAAKSVGAFSGEPLRSNLINQLNHWGFHKWLGLTDSADLVSRGMGVAIVPSLLERSGMTGVVFKQLLDSAATSELRCIWSKVAARKPAVSSFLASVLGSCPADT